MIPIPNKIARKLVKVMKADQMAKRITGGPTPSFGR
jgi:hypothetical protein